MFRNALLTTAILAATTGVALAMPAPYVGASIGITTNTSSDAAYSPSNGAVQSQPANFRGVPFNLFAGYGGILSESFYLAGELFVVATTAEITTNNGVKTSYGYGASILPGLMLSDHTLAFGRLGVVRSHFPSDNANSTGGQFGFGLQTCLTQNVDIRGEYDFTAYKSFNNSIGNVSSPRQDAVSLALVYKFD